MCALRAILFPWYNHAVQGSKAAAVLVLPRLDSLRNVAIARWCNGDYHHSIGVLLYMIEPAREGSIFTLNKVRRLGTTNKRRFETRL